MTKNIFLKKYILNILLVFLIIFFFLRPYEFVIFDSEPDYLANALHINDWNIPWGGHHPGTIVQYFYSFLITLLKFFKLKLEASIIIIRFVSFLISIIIIAFAKNFFVKDKKKFINYSIFFFSFISARKFSYQPFRC